MLRECVLLLPLRSLFVLSPLLLRFYADKYEGDMEKERRGDPADYYFASVSGGEPAGGGGNQLDPSISTGISNGGGLVGGLENSRVSVYK